MALGRAVRDAIPVWSSSPAHKGDDHSCGVGEGMGRSFGMGKRGGHGEEMWGMERRDEGTWGGGMRGGRGHGEERSNLLPAMLTTFSSCALIPWGERTLPSLEMTSTR